MSKTINQKLQEINWAAMDENATQDIPVLLIDLLYGDASASDYAYGQLHYIVENNGHNCKISFHFMKVLIELIALKTSNDDAVHLVADITDMSTSPANTDEDRYWSSKIKTLAREHIDTFLQLVTQDRVEITKIRIMGILSHFRDQSHYLTPVLLHELKNDTRYVIRSNLITLLSYIFEANPDSDFVSRHEFFQICQDFASNDENLLLKILAMLILHRMDRSFLTESIESFIHLMDQVDKEGLSSTHYADVSAFYNYFEDTLAEKSIINRVRMNSARTTTSPDLYYRQMHLLLHDIFADHRVSNRREITSLSPEKLEFLRIILEREDMEILPKLKVYGLPTTHEDIRELVEQFS